MGSIPGGVKLKDFGNNGSYKLKTLGIISRICYPGRLHTRIVRQDEISQLLGISVGQHYKVTSAIRISKIANILLDWAILRPRVGVISIIYNLHSPKTFDSLPHCSDT